MTVQDGRDAHAERRTPRQRPIDVEAVRRSGMPRGAAMFRATRGDREARASLSGVDVGREMFEADRRPPPDAA